MRRDRERFLSVLSDSNGRYNASPLGERMGFTKRYVYEVTDRLLEEERIERLKMSNSNSVPKDADDQNPSIP